MSALNKHAIFDDVRYTYVETIEHIASGTNYVLCASDSGKRCVVELERWLAVAAEKTCASSAPCENHMVTSASHAHDKLELFKSLFCGREDVYAKAYFSKKLQKLCYAPVCLNRWNRAVCRLPQIRCAVCPHRVLASLDDAVMINHFRGSKEDCSDVIGIYPLRVGNTTMLLAADFDGEGWGREARAYMQACESLKAHAYLERSRSGNGGHVWMFFDEPVEACRARAFGTKAITLAMEKLCALPFSAYDRLFPNQDTISEGGFGNLIALPLQGRAYREGNSVFIDDNDEPYADQWRFLSQVQRTPAALVNAASPKKPEAALGELVSVPSEDEPWKPAAFKQSTFPASGVDVVAANMLYVEKTGLNVSAVNALRRLAAFANPDYYRAVAMRKSLSNVPRVIYCGSDGERYIGLPRGCEESLLSLLGETGVEPRVVDKRQVGRHIDVSFAGELRDEQRKAAKALLAHDNGVLAAATGFGKTVLGAYLIAQRGVSTLILVPSTSLLEQWRERMLGFLEIREELPPLLTRTGRVSRKKRSVVGQVGGGRNAPSGIIDVAIPQSLLEEGEVAGEKSVKALVHDYGMVLCDECHHAPSASYERVLKEVQAKYVYGFTATPARKDRLEPIMFMQCGPLRYEFKGKDQAKLQPFKRVLVPRFTGFVPAEELNVESASFAKLLDAACADPDRNALILADVADLVRQGRVPLVLTRRVEHARYIHEKLLNVGIESLLLIGSDNAATKREKLELLRSWKIGKELVVVATGDYVGEGFDENRFDVLLLAAPVSWKGLVAQYVGRLHREREGKQDVLVYDYADTRVNMFDNMFRKRLKEYAALGYEVAAASEDNVASAAFYSDEQCRVQFLEDMKSAKTSVLICSPYANPRRVALLKDTFAAAQGNGAKVAVCLEVVDDGSNRCGDCLEVTSMLRKLGVEVLEVQGKSASLAIVDKRVIWYGDVNLLSFASKSGTSSAQSLRFESVKVATELVEVCGMGLFT